MKVTRHAKRRWFTPQNHARIRFERFFEEYTESYANSMKAALDAMQAISPEINALLSSFSGPVLRHIIAAPPIDYPVNIFEIDKTMPKGGLNWSECEATCLSPLQAPPPDTPDTAQQLPPA